jgi:hypothetical protein
LWSTMTLLLHPLRCSTQLLCTIERHDQKCKWEQVLLLAHRILSYKYLPRYAPLCLIKEIVFPLVSARAPTPCPTELLSPCATHGLLPFGSHAYYLQLIPCTLHASWSFVNYILHYTKQYLSHIRQLQAMSGMFGT